MEITEKKFKIEFIDQLSLLGQNDTYLKLIESKFKTTLIVRGDNIILRGELAEIRVIEKVLNEMIYLIQRNDELTRQDVETILDLLQVNGNKELNGTSENIIFHGSKDVIKARNAKQIEYYQKVLNNDLVFSIGPAGTGKTFLAVAMALGALRRNEVGRIIISRPAVEAGESLGFLPGDLQEKLDPYLRPLFDAMFLMLTPEKMKSLMDKNIIEITPLAYMRGRTLNNSFIILDEAQNTTITQMKMFLTRLGVSSKAVVTGDVTQVDLKEKKNSGLLHIQKLLQNINGIEFVYFSNNDVVRHKLVAEIIRAYEKDDNKKKKKSD